MSEFNNLPILGGSGPKKKAGGFNPVFLMRTVDEDGTVEPEHVRMQTVMTPQGPQVVEQAVLGRSQYVTAEELVELVAQRVVGKLNKPVTIYGVCKRCKEKGELLGSICGSCGDDLYQEYLADKEDTEQNGR